MHVLQRERHGRAVKRRDALGHAAVLLHHAEELASEARLEQEVAVARVLRAARQRQDERVRQLLQRLLLVLQRPRPPLGSLREQAVLRDHFQGVEASRLRVSRQRDAREAAGPERLDDRERVDVRRVALRRRRERPLRGNGRQRLGHARLERLSDRPEQAQEAPLVDSETDARAVGLDRRGPRLVVQQRHLAEVRALLEEPDDLVRPVALAQFRFGEFLRDRHPARLQHV
mmetsp:Transcript_9866/g.30631  ORF Transcript_9866/g.30631 Transcript_9866/m.30631 type:complete len:230 (-) Transcript_9866:62-751(-)